MLSRLMAFPLHAFPRPLLLLLLAAIVVAGDALRPEEWVFHDGRDRTMADLRPNLVVAVNFIAEDDLDSARDYIRSEVRLLCARIEERRLPVRLVCVAPDLIPNQLVGWAREKDLLPALTAWDPYNRAANTRTNDLMVRLIQADGRIETVDLSERNRRKPLTPRVEAVVARPGAARHRFVIPDSIVDDRVLQVWWTVERGQPDAVATARRLARTAPVEARPQLQLLMDSISASFAARCDAALAQPYGLAGVEACEQVLVDYPGLDKAEQRPLLDRIRTVQAEPMYQDEFAARALFRKAMALRKDPLPSRQQQAKAVVGDLRQRYGGTVYGRRAADL
ncbi:MAG: hypothetical protein RLZZ127_1480 [Planctomycetota bacterium]|jgi:hypothetical protein